jgi:hypothetical protein
MQMRGTLSAFNLPGARQVLGVFVNYAQLSGTKRYFVHTYVYKSICTTTFDQSM